MSFYAKNYADLQPGQWVSFAHDKEVLPKEWQGPFKVINRYDAITDVYRCSLMNKEGQLFEYSSSKELTYGNNTLAKSLDLPAGFTLVICDPKSIAKGKEMRAIHRKALDHLERLIRTSNFGRGFDPQGSEKTFTAFEFKVKFGLY